MLGENFTATLRAIAQAGKAQLLSRPSILARNNQPATIQIGQNVPLITNVRYDTFGNAINSVSYQAVGIILKVTPFITSDGMVQMIVSALDFGDGSLDLHPDLSWSERAGHRCALGGHGGDHAGWADSGDRRSHAQ